MTLKDELDSVLHKLENQLNQVNQAAMILSRAGIFDIVDGVDEVKPGESNLDKAEQLLKHVESGLINLTPEEKHANVHETYLTGVNEKLRWLCVCRLAKDHDIQEMNLKERFIDVGPRLNRDRHIATEKLGISSDKTYYCWCPVGGNHAMHIMSDEFIEKYLGVETVSG